MARGQLLVPWKMASTAVRLVTASNCVKNVQTFIVLKINYIIKKYSNLMVSLDYSCHFEIV